MELASMLAGEPFSDHPVSVCPVVGSLLRTYNDSVDDTARQDLYDYAARVVGSRASADVEEARAEHLITWTSGMQRRRFSRFLLRWRLWPMGVPQQTDVVAAIGVHTLLRQRDHHHSEVLTVVDELLAIRATESTATPSGSSAEASSRIAVGA